jgi:uncharacterized membrane protein
MALPPGSAIFLCQQRTASAESAEEAMREPLFSRGAKGILFFFSLLYLSIYLPLAGVIYFPAWYEASCSWHDRCERFGKARSFDYIAELVGYMRHTNDLAGPEWTLKEKWHLAEVRQIFDRLFYAALAAAALFLLFFHAAGLRWAAPAGIGLLLLLCGIFPFFGTFWRDIFHEWLFDNTYWKNNPADVSYYLMPRVFFKHTLMLIIGAAVLVNAALLMAAAKMRGRGGA